MEVSQKQFIMIVVLIICDTNRFEIKWKWSARIIYFTHDKQIL
jgi:hypothetical protein